MFAGDTESFNALPKNVPCCVKNLEGKMTKAAYPTYNLVQKQRIEPLLDYECVGFLYSIQSCIERKIEIHDEP